MTATDPIKPIDPNDSIYYNDPIDSNNHSEFNNLNPLAAQCVLTICTLSQVLAAQSPRVGSLSMWPALCIIEKEF